MTDVTAGQSHSPSSGTESLGAPKRTKTKQAPSASRVPLVAAGAVEVVLVLVAGVLVLLAAGAQAVVQAVQGYAARYAEQHQVRPVLVGARAEVAKLVLATGATGPAPAVKKAPLPRRTPRTPVRKESAS